MTKPIPHVEAKDLNQEQFHRLVAHRARQILDEPVSIPETPGQRREIETRIRAEMEKVHLRRNFLPVRFLADGVERALAVCRIVTRDSLGTGFLVGRGLLMTNNHVLDSVRTAAGSFAEFAFDADSVTPLRAVLQPERFFLTHDDLDFTIVACDDSQLGQIRPIALRRNPATVTRFELVNVIQHPDGRPKEVALQENEVLRVQDKLIHYVTDTEPGSSGSPVFNNQWNLVALHHSGEEVGGGKAENEGIRISAIVAHLLAQGHGRLLARELQMRDQSGFPDTSPYLGFFDAHGVALNGSREVQIADFQGSAQFADVGFWNIEHFNNEISDERVTRVGEVIARLSMDVLGLVEVENGALTRLQRALREQGMDLGFEVQETEGSQDLAVLYDRETTRVTLRSDLLTRHQHRLTARTASGRTAFPRPPLFASCTIQGEKNFDPQRFLLIVVHLKAFGDPQSIARRRLASQMLAEIIQDIRETEGLPVVLGGDFNELLTTDVLHSLSDAPDLLALTSNDADDGAISFVGASHRSLIDHILVSADVQLGEISGDDAAIVRLDRSVRDFSDRVSDHVPIVFRMIYRERGIGIDVPGAGEEGEIHLAIPEGIKALRLSFEKG